MTTIFIDNIEYTIYKQDSGDLLLKPLKSIVILEIDKITQYDLSNSQIDLCLINNKVIEKNKYKSILTYIYNLIGSGTKIIKNTMLNIQTVKKKDLGFYYLDNLGISIPDVDSNKYIYEIMNQCLINKIKLKMNIELENKDVIYMQI